MHLCPFIRLWLSLCAVVAVAMPSAAAPFNFQSLQEKAKTLAASEYKAPPALPHVLVDLNYDQYRAIKTSKGGTLWADRDSPFQIEFMHAGYRFTKPVKMNLLNADTREPSPLKFEKKYFDYSKLVVHHPINEEEIHGFAGFRIRHPLEGGKENFDEIGSFLGASYFRLLGKGQRYGISARGLAINSVLDDYNEEFPDFIEYWLVEPKPADKFLEFYALLDSPSVAGAFRFEIHPGDVTVSKIQVSLYFRKYNPSVGLAPLTSMFWFGENHKERPFGDWRPEVHDSDGLLVKTEGQNTVWRPLYNHHAIRNSWLDATKLQGFGLFQRDREYVHYQDLSNPQHQAPSTWIKPTGDLSAWSTGSIRLIELPTDNEAMDNIVTFFQPKESPQAGESLHYSYDLVWELAGEKDLSPNHVTSTRIGKLKPYPGTRRFVVDFEGPDLNKLPADAPIFAEITSSENGYITENQCFKNVHTGGWRIEFKLDSDKKSPHPVELRCTLKHPTTKKPLSETWSYQWTH
ncbi:glucans biosynthesis protein G [Oceaniferula spumae]|uniref:Glucans biosynthesis protein G n=1 Tax=Oceaniferula spumae TaxID=2979115 RepID=A0AAT9FJD9_9BACT